MNERERCYINRILEEKTMTNDEKNKLLDIFYRANEEFLKRDVKNILLDVSERNLCALLSEKIAYILSNSKFKQYYSDPEYNRDGEEVKAIIIPGEETIVTVTCDLIIHSRGELDKDNLIAIEMKKSNANMRSKNKDRIRLKALTMELDSVYHWKGKLDKKVVAGYELGIFYELNRFTKTIIIEIYSNGRLENVETNTFEYFQNYKDNKNTR